MRVHDWDVRLADCIEASRAQPFQWGQHDCAIWAMSVRLNLRGRDVKPDWFGKYKTAKGAARHMLRMDAKNLEEAGRITLGAPIAPLLAQRGDIVLTHDPDAPSDWPEVFGVCLGRDVAVVTADGLATHPLMAARLAWRT